MRINKLYNKIIYIKGSWRRLAPQTEKKLGSWMEHFQRRQRQYHDWTFKSEPACIWLSGLHIPESYLTALV